MNNLDEEMKLKDSNLESLDLLSYAIFDIMEFLRSSIHQDNQDGLLMILNKLLGFMS